MAGNAADVWSEGCVTLWRAFQIEKRKHTYFAKYNVYGDRRGSHLRTGALCPDKGLVSEHRSDERVLKW